MKYNPKFYGKKVGGSFKLHDPKSYAKHLQLFEEGQELEMTLKKMTKSRTQGLAGEGSNQNGYFWGVIIRMIADHIGELDQDYVHDAVLVAVGHFKEVLGTKVPKETKDMEAGEFQELMKRIQIWASKTLDLYIPDPYEIVDNY